MGSVRVYDPVPEGSPMPWEREDLPSVHRVLAFLKVLLRTRTTKLVGGQLFTLIVSAALYLGPRFGLPLTEQEAQTLATVVIVVGTLIVQALQGAQRAIALRRGNLPSKDLGRK